MKKYNSMHSLKQNIAHLIEKENLDQALRCIHDCVERIITEPLCTAQIFGSKDLDAFCQDIGKINFTKIRSQKIIPKPSQKPNSFFVYIVSKLQNSGGHTRIIQDFIRARPEGQHIILSTELDGKSDPSYLMQALGTANLSLELSARGNYQKKLSWLQQRLIEIDPLKVYLFNHHQDSVAVASLQPDMGFKGAFYHHGDHHLCLGVYLSYLEHIDPHPVGYHYCRNTLKINNDYIPFTAEDRSNRLVDKTFMQDGILRTCTVARGNKIEIPYMVSYLEILPVLLKTTGGRHIHIGKLTPWALFKIRRGLKSKGIALDRFVYIPWVPSVWQVLSDLQVDLYIASFPYGAGLTLIEVMGAGVPVILHRHIFSRVLSGIELAYPGVLNWRYSEELLSICSKISPAMLSEHGRLAREQYEAFHRPEILTNILKGSEQALSVPTLSEAFSIELDESVFWMKKQLGLAKIARNGIYRLLKRCRAKLSCLL